ncbi:hypothetical protein HUSEC41_26222, partial [Escherichia coli O104:H4 str. 01-09591]
QQLAFIKRYLKNMVKIFKMAQELADKSKGKKSAM